jgi:hypothetical protein
MKAALLLQMGLRYFVYVPACAFGNEILLSVDGQFESGIKDNV